MSKSLQERVLERLEKRAAGKLAKPADVRVYLGARFEDYVDGDSIDNESIDYAIDQLVKRRPHIAAPITATDKPASLQDAITQRMTAGTNSRRASIEDALRTFKPDAAQEIRAKQFRTLQRSNPAAYNALPGPLKASVIAYENRKRAAEMFAATGEIPAEVVATLGSDKPIGKDAS